MQRPILITVLVLAGCGEAVKDDHFAKELETQSSEPAPVDPSIVPVRVGEHGASFNACNAAGTARGAGDSLPVRAAPFDVAKESGNVPAGARFFICSRSHDQRWLGIVYEESGTLATTCGVSRPVTVRGSYDGPCRSGWVASAFVKQIAG